MRNIAISDIHGCNKTFHKLLEEQVKLTKKDHLYLLGDYIDRGPDSKGVLDYMMELKKDGFQISTTRGNHEQLLLRALFGDTNEPWYNNGNKPTLESFDVKHEIGIPEEYINYIKELEYYFELNDCLLVHAGFNFKRDDPFEGRRAMLWIRGMDLDNDFLKGRRIIHGHSPIPKEQIEASLDGQNINIDAGCVYKEREKLGNLCAFDLSNNELYFQKNID